MVKYLMSCVLDMDTACVELKFLDDSMIAIDTIAMENEVYDNMYQRSKRDYLIYNAPLVYADRIRNGKSGTYLNMVVEEIQDSSVNQQECNGPHRTPDQQAARPKTEISVHHNQRESETDEKYSQPSGLLCKS